MNSSFKDNLGIRSNVWTFMNLQQLSDLFVPFSEYIRFCAPSAFIERIWAPYPNGSPIQWMNLQAMNNGLLHVCLVTAMDFVLLAGTLFSSFNSVVYCVICSVSFPYNQCSVNLFFRIRKAWSETKWNVPIKCISTGSNHYGKSWVNSAKYQ